MSLTSSKERWALSFLENLKYFWEKAFPEDQANIIKINDMIHSICWRISEKENIKDADEV